MMPIYEMKNTETGEIFDIEMSIKEYDEYKKANPHIERHFSTMHFSDAVVLGIKKPPTDFTEGVINRIKKANPYNNMSSRWD
jgi:gamma-glutamyl phosphate reductase